MTVVDDCPANSPQQPLVKVAVWVNHGGCRSGSREFGLQATFAPFDFEDME